LAVERVGGDDAPLERQQVQQLRHRRDLVGLAVDRKLTQQQPLVRRPGMDHVQRRLACGPVEGAPQCFAVNRHHALQGFGKALHEAGEAGLKRRGVEKPEHPAEGVVARDAVPQTQELPQERRLDLAKQRHVRTVLAAGQHGAERDQQQFMQVMAGVILPRVNDLGKAGDELFHGRASTLNPTFRGQPRHSRQPSPSTVICDSPAQS